MTDEKKKIPKLRFKVVCSKCKMSFRIIADKKPTNFVCPKCK